MSDADTEDPEIERLIRSAPTLRDLVRNTVALTDRYIDYDRYVREISPGLTLSGLSVAERFDRVAAADSGFSTDPELSRYGNCFFFSILGYAHDLYVALPRLTDAGLDHRVSAVVQAVCEIPEAYIPELGPDEAPPESAVPAPVDEDDATFLRSAFASALIFVEGWFASTYAGVADVPMHDELPDENARQRFADYERQLDPGWEPRAGSCNFVMAD